ncbi:MAG: SAVED domain-containing protein [Parvibaculaceae bacterium]
MTKTTGRGKTPSQATKNELWARSAGVCQKPGCGRVLYRDEGPYWEPINLGEMAHNVASSAQGPRGGSRSADLSDDPDNLLMLCGTHHTAVDRLVGAYREATLRGWKRRHEQRVLAAALQTQGDVAIPLVVHATQIGGHRVTVDDQLVVSAILEHGLTPAHVKPYRIVLNTDAQPDDVDAYWAMQINTLRQELKHCQAMLTREWSNAPWAVFALAEMPVLMALGNALGDKSATLNFSYARHVPSWAYQTPDAEAPNFTYEVRDDLRDRAVALVLELSAAVETARVETALGSDRTAIVRLSCPTPSTELVQSEACVTAFKRTVRQCLTDIETASSRDTQIHVFPCMPAALAVAFGSCVMPKVSNPLVIYDAKNRGGEFRPTLTLPLPLTAANELAAVS